MIALVAGNDIEHHTPELLLHVAHWANAVIDHLQHLFVAVGAHQIVILMRQSTQGLHVQFVTIVETIKTFSHEMTVFFFFQQTAFVHVDTGSTRHPVIGILNLAIAFGIFQFPVLVAANAIKLQQPIAEVFQHLHLAGARFVDYRIPGNHLLGTGTTSQILI